MTIDIIILIVSLVCLLLSADRLIDVVVLLAERLKISTMVIGLTVVAIGTSLPEAAASVAAALEGHPEIALGNVIGSNICNVALILGIPALIGPIVCARSVLRREGFLMLSLSFFLWGLALVKAQISGRVGIFFILGFFTYIFLVFRFGQADRTVEENSEVEKNSKIEKNTDAQVECEKHPEHCSVFATTTKLVLSIIVLLLSSKYLVEATISLAKGLGISENVIALSVIALGTSLPELSVSIAAVRRNQGDILVGNILGSNISNILLVLGLTSVISPINIEPLTTNLDIPMMLLTSSLMLAFLWDKVGISRGRGIFFLIIYAVGVARCFCFPN